MASILFQATKNFIEKDKIYIILFFRNTKVQLLHQKDILLHQNRNLFHCQKNWCFDTIVLCSIIN